MRFLTKVNPLKSEVNLSESDYVTFLPMESIGEFGGFDDKNTKSLDEVYKGYTYFKDNDIIIAKITPCFENGKGTLVKNLMNGVGFGTTELHVLRAKEYILPKYLIYISYSEHFRKFGASEMLGAGGQKRVPENFIKDYLVFYPPLKEQELIINFLDFKTFQIDKLIDEKEKLLELLEEKRISLITNAVTKGLNPDVKMKPSGIDWLGDIPEHWTIKRLKYLSKIKFSGVNKKTEEGEIDVLLCNYVDVYNNEFIDSNIEFMKATATEKEIEKFSIENGDILVTKDSESPDDIAIPAIVVEDFDGILCGYHLAQLKPNKNILVPEYLFRLFQAKNFNSHFTTSANGVTRFGVGTDVFGDAVVPVFHKEEQLQIVGYIKENLNKINLLRDDITCAVEKLKEYRSALITSAVTGKIDVRNFKQEYENEKAY
jgi:type I restriction enzyme S subunit